MPPEEPLPRHDDPSLQAEPRVQQVSGVAPRPRPSSQSASPADFSIPASAGVPKARPPGRVDIALSTLARAAEQLGHIVAEAQEAQRVLKHEASPPTLLEPVPDAGPGESRVQQLERQLVTERRLAAAERWRIIEQNDQFLALLFEEHEADLRQVQRERDEVLQQVSRIRQAQPGPRDALSASSAQEPARPRTKTDPGLGGIGRRSSRAQNPADPGVEPLATVPPPVADPLQELEELRHQVRSSNSMVDRLLSDKRRSLELIRRLQLQRDEAQRELLTFRREHTGSPESLARRRSSPQNERPTDPAPAVAPPRAPGLSAPQGWDTSGLRPQPPPSLSSATPMTRREPLGRMRSEPPPELGPALLDATEGRGSSATAPSSLLKPKPSLAERPLVGYSMSGEELDAEPFALGPRE
jgi:hypothetical protein